MSDPVPEQMSQAALPVVRYFAVTDLQIFPIHPRNGHIAFGSCVITIADNLRFSLGNIAIYTRPGGGFRLVYPNKVLPSGLAVPCFRPLTQEIGRLLERAFVEKMESVY